MRIEIPRSVKSDSNGYRYLISVYHLLQNINNTDVIIDFHKNRWFEANLFALLGAIIYSGTRGSNYYTLVNLSTRLESVLLRNGFIQNTESLVIADPNSTIIPYETFSPKADTEFALYIKTELLAKTGFPRLSRLAEKKIIESIFEIFENARTHGVCDKIYTCGQYFPRKNPPRLDITIVDMGVSIKKNVNEFLKKELSAAESIEWAVEYGNTTKTGLEPGGLGLDVIRSFISKNNGKIQIVSDNGYWEFNRNYTGTNSFLEPFPGTIVNIEFNLDDNTHYIAKEESEANIIF